VIAYLTPVASGDQSSPPKPQVFDGPRFPFLDVIRALESANLALFEPAKLRVPALLRPARSIMDRLLQLRVLRLNEALLVYKS